MDVTKKWWGSAWGVNVTKKWRATGVGSVTKKCVGDDRGADDRGADDAPGCRDDRGADDRGAGTTGVRTNNVYRGGGGLRTTCALDLSGAP